MSIQSQILNLLLDLRGEFGLTYLFIASLRVLTDVILGEAGRRARG